jgi:hypothetical protein
LPHRENFKMYNFYELRNQIVDLRNNKQPFNYARPHLYSSSPSPISIPHLYPSSLSLIPIPHHHPSQVRANRHQRSCCQVGCVPRRRGEAIGQGSAGAESRRVYISVSILTIEFDGVVSSRVRASAAQYYRALYEIDIAHGISLISAPCAQRSLDDSSNLTGLDLQEWVRLSHAHCVLHKVYFSSLHSRFALTFSFIFTARSFSRSLSVFALLFHCSFVSSLLIVRPPLYQSSTKKGTQMALAWHTTHSHKPKQRAVDWVARAVV